MFNSSNKSMHKCTFGEKVKQTENFALHGGRTHSQCNNAATVAAGHQKVKISSSKADFIAQQVQKLQLDLESLHSASVRCFSKGKQQTALQSKPKQP